MTGTVEIVVKTIDESSAEIEGIADAFADAETNVENLIDSFIKGDTALEKFSDEFKEMFKAVEAGTLPMEDAIKRMEEIAEVTKVGEKQAEGFGKQLGGIAKGLIGIGTAFAIGRGIVKFGKDSFAAADAAGLLPPIFDEAEQASQRLKEAVGEKLGDSLEGTTKIITRMTNATADNLEGQTRINKAIDAGIITQKEVNRLRRPRGGGGPASDVLVIRRLNELEEERVVQQKEANALRLEEVQLRHEELGITESLVKANEANEGLMALTLMDVNKINQGLDFSAAEQIGENKRFREMLEGRGALDVRTGLGGEIAGALDQVKLMEAGTLDVQNNVDATVRAYQQQLIDVDTYTQLLKQSAIQQAQIDLSTGETANKWQAIAQLAEDANISQDEAARILSGNVELVDRSFLIPQEVRAEEKPVELIQPLDGPLKDLEEIRNIINGLADTTIDVNVNFVGNLAGQLTQELE